MRILRFLITLAIAGLAVSAAVAQSGAIEVEVRDGEGNPLPGAIVTITHDTSFVKEFAVVTDKKGIASFPVLRPGPGYNIQVEFPGFSPLRHPGLRVSINDTTRLPVQMIQQIEERVKVTATRDVVDLESPAQETRFTDDFIQDLPVPGRYYQNVLTLAPGVQDADGDGNPNVHGSRSRDFSTMVGGVRNVDPLTGQWMSNVNPNSIEEVEVITAGASVAYGRAQGGFANIIQKQGSNEHEGVFDFLLQTSKLDGDGARGSNSQLPTADFETIVPGFQLSGPLVRDKFWYRFSHEYRKREDPINTGSGTVVRTTVAGTHSDQLTWQVSPRNKLAFSFQTDPLEEDNLGVSSFVDPSSALIRDSGSDVYTLRWTAPYSPKVLVESLLSWQEGSNKFRPTSSGDPNDCIAVGPSVLTDGQCTDLELGQVTGSSNFLYDDRRQRLTFDSKATIFGPRFLGMNHQFQFGMIMENERFFRDQTERPEVFYYVVDFPSEDTDQGGGNEIEKFGIAFLTVSTPISDDSRATSTNFGFSVEDRIKPLQNLTITLGLRMDREEINSEGISPFDARAELARFQSGESWESSFTGFEAQDDFVSQMVDILCADVDPSTIGNCRTNAIQQTAAQNLDRLHNVRRRDDITLSNTNFSPQVALAWSPWSNGKTVLTGSYRRYYNLINLAIPLKELEPATSTLQYKVDLADDSATIEGRISPTVNVETIDRNLKTPYQDEFSFEIQRELWAETSLSFGYIKRKYRDQLQDKNINLNVGDYGRCIIHRPQSGTLPFAASPGTGTLIDPYTGLSYFDDDEGPGDGRIDDCSGDLEPFAIALEGGGEDDGRERTLYDRQIPDGVLDLYFQNPFWGDIYFLSNFNSSEYDGYVLELERRQYRGWELSGSYTWSESTGDGEDYDQGLGDDPSLDDFVSGFQSNDQRHVVKLNATTITPWGIRLGTVTSWQSGLPYSLLLQQRSINVLPLETAPLVGTAVTNRQSYPTGVRNSERNRSFWNIDLRATREFTLGRQMNLQLAAEVFNVLDDGRYVVYNTDTDAGRQVNGNAESFYEFGRRWQLQAKLSF